MTSQIIALVGISGSGKTTIGRFVANRLNYIYVDLDDFYKRDKPKITLSNGITVSNWDTLDALDLSAFRQTLASLVREKRNIIVGGFALSDDVFEQLKPTATILLSVGNTDSEIISRTIEARRRSKGFAGHKAIQDELMVKEVVYPYFKNVLQNTNVTGILKIYEQEQRRNLEELANTLIEFINED
jgi:shikimate kinase